MRVAVLLLAACAAQPMAIPSELRECEPPAIAAPRPLGRGTVSPEQLRAHDAAERAARRAAETTLVACANRLTRLNELIGRSR